MTLLSEASFLVTPNGYKEDKLYAVIPTNGDGDMTVTRATTATRVDENDLVSSVASNVPRIDYTGGGCPSILLEPQRTNLVLRSQEFDNASFQKNLSSIVANTTTAPDGTSTADTWTGDGTNSQHSLAQSVSATSGVAYTQSVFAKKGTNNFLQIVGTGTIYTTATVFANFDLDTGVVGLAGAGATSTITDFGNGWYRCTMTATATATTSGNGFLLWLINSATSVRAESNSLATSVHLWGAQLEAGAYPTSYIPTTTASVTRNTDTCVKTGISDLIGQTAGVLFVESAALFDDLTYRAISISDGTSSNRLYLIYLIVSNQVQISGVTGGSFFLGPVFTLADETDFAKIALRYRVNDITLWVNGEKRGTDITSYLLPSVDFTRLGFDSGAGFSPFYGKAKQVQLYKTYLSDAQMAALTTL